jgi:hypothetical protein
MASFVKKNAPTSPGGSNAKPVKNIRFGPNGEQVKAEPRKGSFINLLSLGGGQKNAQKPAFDNGIDPFGRLSTDSAPPPPSPISTPKQASWTPTHWVEEIFPLSKLPSPSSPPPPPDLLARIHYFFSLKDPTAVDKSLHVAMFAVESGEATLNAKLFHRFGEGLPLRVPGRKVQKDAPVPKTLREIIRTFLLDNDPRYLQIEGERGLDQLLAQASEYGIESVDSEFVRRYGIGLPLRNKANSTNVSSSPKPWAVTPLNVAETPVIPARKISYDEMAKIVQPTRKTLPQMQDLLENEQVQTLVEVSLEDSDENPAPLYSPLGGGPAKRHDFFDDKSLRADLKLFYMKHDPKKMDPQKLEPIVQWAYKIGPSELNRRFEEKYGESLTSFLDDLQNGRPGVAPGPKNNNINESRAEESSMQIDGCGNYQEVNPGKGFGVCVCGLSRADHKSISTLLVFGNEEPRFKRSAPPKKSATKPVPHQPPTAVALHKIPVKPLLKPVYPAPKFEIKEEGKDGPCNEYRLDLEGRAFGVCKCGWNKPSHFNRD